MSWVMVLAVLAAGAGAGFLNAVVGSGTLITFPTLLFFGLPAVVANISNSVGLVPGFVSSALGYRDELRGVRWRLKNLLIATVLGAVVGALALLWLPASAFKMIVPVLIALSVLLVAFGPRIQRWSAARHGAQETPLRRVLATVGIFLCGIYGAYFGAAQGTLIIGVTNVTLDEDLQTLNAIKNVLGAVNNAIAVAIFVIVRPSTINWPVAGLIAVGAFVGAWIGTRIGKRLPPAIMRGAIVVVGLVAIVKLVFF